jgi:hypothetical protein
VKNICNSWINKRKQADAEAKYTRSDNEKCVRERHEPSTDIINKKMSCEARKVATEKEEFPYIGKIELSIELNIAHVNPFVKQCSNHKTTFF